MKDKTTLVFTGDIGFDHYMDHKWEDDALISDDLLSLFHDADHVIINIEGPLVDKDAGLVQSREMRLMHTIDPAAVRVFNNMHADIWNLVNNHMMDAGAFGLEKTLEEAARAKVSTIGAGMDIASAAKPVILQEAGGIGIFGVGYRRGCKPAGEDQAGCFLWNDMERIKEVISQIKAQCRWCIMVVHGGEEFTALPSPYTRERYLQYLDFGADIIVGHHPHVPMNYELLGDKAIFYSLGNFIFDTNYQRAQFHTEEGVVLSLTLSEESWSFRAQGIVIDRAGERVLPADLPRIFVNVPEKEYQLLSPLSVKMFLAATKRQQIFLYPEQFQNASEEEWERHFLDPHRSGRVPGEALDFQVLCPIAKEADNNAWEQSSLTDIKNYLLEQM